MIRHAIRILTALLVAITLVGAVGVYAGAEDPPFWPRGESFCGDAPIDHLEQGAEAYGSWLDTDLPTVATVNGRRYFHPVSTAQVILGRLIAGDTDGARGLTDWMYAHAEGGWLPYGFDWEWPTGHTIEAPWYSAMAQGQALSVYTRLEEWDRAAEAFGTVVSIQRDDGWLPEYPAGPDVLNGHIFATIGLYDYWQATGRGEAETLAAIRAVAERLPEWRRVGRVSRYAGSYPAWAYHELHVRLLGILADISGDACFDAAAAAFRSDWP